ncbi:MAG: HNH endonuclease family protein [Actinomycetaceae bacterium]|nr:HNH endonuclease family protein [Actinomycetaceae bacterium]
MKRIRLGDVIVLIVVVVAAVAIAMWSGAFGPRRATTTDVPASKVRDQLEQLEVRGFVDAPEYFREEFGEPWADVDNNGCDTRNDILARDIDKAIFRGPCIVDAGILSDPFSGQTIYFERGEKTSPLVQIDHVVPLSNAWYAGAWQWDLATRERFANDPQNLLAVSGAANQDKGNLSADQWLPENKDYHCAYVARQIHVKATWGLSVTEAERQAMIDVLADCPVVEVPKG